MRQLFIKCSTCDGEGDVIVDLECGCCQIFEDCKDCDGVGFIEFDPEVD